MVTRKQKVGQKGLILIAMLKSSGIELTNPEVHRPGISYRHSILVKNYKRLMKIFKN